MRRVLKWVWAPAVLAAALVFVPSSEAKAQQVSYFYGGPRVSFGFSSGYGPAYGPQAFYPPPVPYGGYYGRRVYTAYPYGPPRPHYGHWHGGPGCRRW
jgi:hypothetical protein